MTSRILLGTALMSVFAARVMLADVAVGEEKYFDSRWAEVEKTFQAAKEGRDFSRVKQELRKFFSSESQDTKALGLRWLGYHRAEITSEELDDFSKLFLDLNSRSSLSEGVRVEMANRHLANAPAEERRAMYLTAVRTGSVKLEGVEKMPRFVALGRAAADGLEEFRPFVEQYREEINTAYPADPYRRSDKLIWMLKLRAGAKDRADAVRLHATRLAEIEDERLARLMDDDPAFREATMNLLQSACEKQLSEPCLNMGRIALRQGKLREQRVKADPRKQEAIGHDSTDWLEGLRGLTGPARVKVEREKVEASASEPK